MCCDHLRAQRAVQTRSEEVFWTGAILPTVIAVTAVVAFASGILDGVSMIGLTIRTLGVNAEVHQKTCRTVSNAPSEASALV
jgi:hypothetical protein